MSSTTSSAAWATSCMTCRPVLGPYETLDWPAGELGAGEPNMEKEDWAGECSSGWEGGALVDSRVHS
jgi:hypothetical protein